jgi:hypothetical protein
MDCASVLIINKIVEKVTLAMASCPIVGVEVHKNVITPRTGTKFIAIYRGTAENTLVSWFHTSTHYSLMYEFRCRGESDDESENILAYAANSILGDDLLDGLASSVEYAGSFAEYDNSGVSSIYLAVGRIVVRYMLNKDNQFELI